MLLLTLLLAGSEPPLKTVEAITKEKPSGLVAVQGVVAARSQNSESEFSYFLQDDTGIIPILFKSKPSVLPRVRDSVKVMGLYQDNPNLPQLVVADPIPAPVVVLGTNKTIANSELLSPLEATTPEKLKTLRHRYVAITNIGFQSTGQFSLGQFVLLGSPEKKVRMQVGQGLQGLPIPQFPINFYGVVAEDSQGSYLVPGRWASANSSAVRVIATKWTCITCHSPDQKIIGPAYKDVAAKYKNDPKAVEKIKKQIEDGGSGQWGPVAMQGFKSKIPPEEIETLARWIYEMRWEEFLK